MMLDERIRDDLRSAVAQVPAGSPRALADVKRRGSRRRRTKRGIWMTLSTIPIVLFLVLALPYDPNAIDPAGTHGIETVRLADLAVPVTGGEPVHTDPEIWIGLPGPSPEFDIDRFGPELAFELGEPSADDLNDRVESAVYLGELEGEPFYVYSQSAPSFWDRLFETLAGNFSGDILGTSLNCCSGGNMDHENGLPGFSVMTATNEPRLIVAEWLGLPPDVSVVAYQMDGEFVGWQTPVGGVSSIRLDQVPDEIVFIAFDAQGEEVNRFALSWSPDGDPTSASDTVGDRTDGSADFVSQGLVIELDDVPSELRRVIEITAEDQLFRVPLEGQDVYVVLSQRRGHVYAESCATLSTGDLPEGLRASCLERTIGGQTERGMFHYPEDTD